MNVLYEHWSEIFKKLSSEDAKRLIIALLNDDGVDDFNDDVKLGIIFRLMRDAMDELSDSVKFLP